MKSNPALTLSAGFLAAGFLLCGCGAPPPPPPAVPAAEGAGRPVNVKAASDQQDPAPAADAATTPTQS